MKTISKLLAVILVLAFSLLLAGSLPPAALGRNVAEANRYNVVLVVDKSGSLCDRDGYGTDPDGLRYDAMRLFLGLLTETGNHAGVIAFDEKIRSDSGIVSVGPMEERDELVRTVEALGTSYDTDIGSAVLRAVDNLCQAQKENGLPGVVLLLTDGMTDFTSDAPRWLLFEKSMDAALTAREKALENDIVIHGIFLNVDGLAQRGEEEVRFYTDGTHGKFETVTRSEDLASAFARFYSIINKTEYNPSDKVQFASDGKAETVFTVPSFGTEEVNLVLEHKEPSGGPESIRITAPDGSDYDIRPHRLETSRFDLIKIPSPSPGIWKVSLQGTPGGSFDVCTIRNASLGAALRCEPGGDALEVLKPVHFSVEVTESGAAIGKDALGSTSCDLTVQDLGTGETAAVPMTVSEGGYDLVYTPENGGEYAYTAVVRLENSEIRSNTLYSAVHVPPPAAVLEAVSALSDTGRIRDNIWEISLSELFTDPKGLSLRYSLSDDLGGAAGIDSGILRIDLERLSGPVSFLVLAEDPYGLTAELPFSLEVSVPEAKLAGAASVTDIGSVASNVWEIPLEALFEDPSGNGLSFRLSDDLGGAASVEDGLVRIKLDELDGEVRFTLIASDPNGLSAEIPFTLSVSLPSADAGPVADVRELGSIRDNIWTLPLDPLFTDPSGEGLTYTLSENPNDALSLQDGVLRADLEKLGEHAVFSVTAVDSRGLSAVLPFDLSVSLPAAAVECVDDISACGAVKDNVWELPLGPLFSDPYGEGLAWTLSDDFGGALSIQDGILFADLEKLGEHASFAVTAEDARGIRTELPFALSVSVPKADADCVRDYSSVGTIKDNVWQVPLDSLFRSPAGEELSYSLSDDAGGALSIRDGILYADFEKLGEHASFIVTAADSLGLRAEVPFELSVSLPGAAADCVRDYSSVGTIKGNVWQVPLDSLFRSPAGEELSYSLSDDAGGALSIRDGILCADLEKLDKALSFTVTAADSRGLTAEVSFDLPTALPEKAAERVAGFSAAGTIKDNIWEVPLDSLFRDPAGEDLAYSLSDDAGGALSIRDGILYADLEKLEGTVSFAVTAANALGFSSDLPFSLEISRPSATVSEVSSLLEIGQLQDGIWTADLHSLFNSPSGAELRFSLSDDGGGAVSVQDGVLSIDTGKLEDRVSFTVYAADADGLSASLPFRLAFEAPSAPGAAVSDLSSGQLQEQIWTLDLADLFEDPSQTGLCYTLSDDLDGAASIENGVLHIDFAKLKALSAFTVTATDAYGHSAELPIALDVTLPSPTAEKITDPFAVGSFTEDGWEADLSSLFDGFSGMPVYTLSDDYDGGIVIEDGILRVRTRGLDNLSFTVNAEDANGLRTALPFDLAFPAPCAVRESMEETVKTGLFQIGTWSADPAGLFSDPKDTPLEYAVSDDCDGRISVTDGRITADLSGTDKAAFSILATDALGLTAELPCMLTSHNMTWGILICALIIFLLAALLFLYVKHHHKSRRKS